MWQNIATMIDEEFGGTTTALQVEHKWKSLERAYKRTKNKNGSSGHSRVSCEFEEELMDVLEKEHHVSPTILLAPGNMVEKENSAPTAEEDRGTSSVADVEQPGVADQEQRHAQKRKREGSFLAKLLKELQECRKERAERFAHKMWFLAGNEKSLDPSQAS
ncbi:hypothetical protein MTO96_033796 [Rhipicephalus appendiculatus]